MKKLLCAVLSGIMAFSTFAVAVPITASAAESQESVSATYGDFEYEINDSSVAITKYTGSLLIILTHYHTGQNRSFFSVSAKYF